MDWRGSLLRLHVWIYWWLNRWGTHTECLTLSSVKAFSGEPCHNLPFGLQPYAWNLCPTPLKGQELPNPVTHRRNRYQLGKTQREKGHLGPLCKVVQQCSSIKLTLQPDSPTNTGSCPPSLCHEELVSWIMGVICWVWLPDSPSLSHSCEHLEPRMALVYCWERGWPHARCEWRSPQTTSGQAYQGQRGHHQTITRGSDSTHTCLGMCNPGANTSPGLLTMKSMNSVSGVKQCVVFYT